jgi:hypothetical protein
MLRRVLLAIVFMALPVVAMAGDDLPKRLWEEPPGVRTMETRAPDEAKPTGNFVLGFEPQAEVTGEAPMTIDAPFVMKVKEKWPNCDVDRVCGNLVYLDCGSAMDGPAYYINGKTFEVLSTCGGVCMNPDEPCDCPPAAWKKCTQTPEGSKQ